MNYWKPFYIILLSLSPAVIQAAENEIINDSILNNSIELDEVLVSTYRYNTNLRQLAAPVQIINSVRIDKNDIGDVSAMLNLIPGVHMQSGTFQTNKITVRGIGSRSSYGTNRTRAYLDDIPLTAGDGTTVVDDMELGFIEKINQRPSFCLVWLRNGRVDSFCYHSSGEECL